MHEIEDQERRIPPASVRARAGFAKTHGRQALLGGEWYFTGDVHDDLIEARTPDDKRVMLDPEGKTWAYVTRTAITEDGTKVQLNDDGTYTVIED